MDDLQTRRVEAAAKALHKYEEDTTPNWIGMTDWTEYTEEAELALAAADAVTNSVQPQPNEYSLPKAKKCYSKHNPYHAGKS